MKATQLIDENKSEDDALSEARELFNSNPVALEITVQWMFFVLTLAPTPEIKAIIYAGKTFGCSIHLLSKFGSLVFLSCSCHHAPEAL